MSISRFNRACGEIRNSGTAGEFGLQIDLTNLPSPIGTIAAMTGDTFYFTCWYRDFVGVPTSNFADGQSVTFH